MVFLVEALIGFSNIVQIIQNSKVILYKSRDKRKLETLQDYLKRTVLSV